MEQIIQVFAEMIARISPKAAAQIAIGTRRIDKQNVEPNQAENRQENQDDIGQNAAAMGFRFHCTVAGVFRSRHILFLLSC